LADVVVFIVVFVVVLVDGVRLWMGLLFVTLVIYVAWCKNNLCQKCLVWGKWNF